MEEESLCHIKQWKKEACKLIGHPITEKAAPTGKQAIILFSCFDCNYVNKMVTNIRRLCTTFKEQTQS